MKNRKSPAALTQSESRKIYHHKWKARQAIPNFEP